MRKEQQAAAVNGKKPPTNSMSQMTQTKPDRNAVA